MKRLSPRFLLGLGVSYTLFITYISLTPPPDVEVVSWPYVDKLAHLAIHSALVFIWLGVVYATDRYHIISRKWMLALVICFLYGIVIEAFQHWFTRTREFDLIDIVANGIGGLIGFLTFWILSRRRVF